MACKILCYGAVVAVAIDAQGLASGDKIAKVPRLTPPRNGQKKR